MNPRPFNTSIPYKDPKVMAHLLGLGLDCTDGHKRITQADKFSILGGSDETHGRMTETLLKTMEDLSIKGKDLNETDPEELSDIIAKNSPAD
ncbi:hypothetical protein N9H22_03570 [Opitutales bacterium]|jgi:hypothetical protein|nr:hypothetical protein [Opitutales bacterium]MDB3957792.1 hypothetical protein [Opitutales bacterium]